MPLLGTRADFAQLNPAWAGQLLGNSDRITIGAEGCLVAAGASVAQAHGKDTNPEKFNVDLRNKKVFGGDDKCTINSNDFISKVYPDIKFVERKDWPKEEVAPAEYFDVRADLKTDVIIKIDYHPQRPGIQEHWCRVIGLNASKSDVEIVDAYDGKRKWLSTIAKPGQKTALQVIWAAVKYTSH